MSRHETNKHQFKNQTEQKLTLPTLINTHIQITSANLSILRVLLDVGVPKLVTCHILEHASSPRHIH